jgi:hypothetical protein
VENIVRLAISYSSQEIYHTLYYVDKVAYLDNYVILVLQSEEENSLLKSDHFVWVQR